MQKLVNTLEQVDKRNSSSRKLNHLQKPSIHDPGIEDIANGDGVSPSNLKYKADAGTRWAYHNVGKITRRN
jgi:hypothetical protein